MRSIWFGATALLIFCLSMQQANSAEYKNEWKLSLSYLTLNKNLAVSEGISNKGYSIGGSFSGYFNQFFKYGLGGSFIIISDKNKFTQQVQNINSGHRSTESSSVNGGMLNGELGAEYRFGEKNQHASGLMLGYHFISVERGIDNCGNCDSRNINLDSSAYIKPYYTYHINKRYFLKLELALLSEEQSFDKILTLAIGFK